MRTLITGGGGYIGSVTAHVFSRANHEVTVFDNLSNGNRHNLPRGAKFIRGDVCKQADLHKALSGQKFDIILHFAAKIRADESIRKPIDYIETNYVGAANTLEAAAECGVKNFILASSAAIYGNTTVIPTTESTPPAPLNPYGISKLMAEQISEIYGTQHSMNWLALRFFNVAGSYDSIGPNKDSAVSLIPVLVRQVAGAQQFTVYKSHQPTKDGTGTRDFVHVADVAWAHLLAAELMVNKQMTLKTIINIGSGVETSILEVVNELKSIITTSINYKLANPRAGDPTRSLADITKAKKVLNWRPQHSLSDIVTSAWEWQQQKD